MRRTNRVPSFACCLCCSHLKFYACSTRNSFNTVQVKQWVSNQDLASIEPRCIQQLNQRNRATIENQQLLPVRKRTIQGEKAMFVLHCGQCLFRSDVVTSERGGWFETRLKIFWNHHCLNFFEAAAQHFKCCLTLAVGDFGHSGRQYRLLSYGPSSNLSTVEVNLKWFSVLPNTFCSFLSSQWPNSHTSNQSRSFLSNYDLAREPCND